MAHGTLLRLRGSGMTGSAMLRLPSTPMRVRVIRNRSTPFVAHPALLRLRSSMAVIAMLIAPSCQMGVGMGTDFRLMTQRTAGAIAFAGMTVITVIAIPAGIVRLGPGVGMTGIT